MFNPTCFNNTMDYLRKNVLLPREFALQVSKSSISCKLPAGFTEVVGSWERYAFSLGKKELENCLVCLLQENKQEVKARILQVLELRMSPRLISLIWALTQYYYELPEMRKAAQLAASSELCTEELLAAMFTKKQDFIEEALNIIILNEGLIAKVVSEYNIILGSPLSNEIILRFFEKGNEQDFLVNEEFLFDIIDQTTEEKILPVLINYLTLPWAFYSSRKINKKLLERFGLPEDGISPIWTKVNDDLIRKYQQWIFLDIMEDFFGPESRRYLVFRRYYQDMKHIRLYHDDGVMVLNFGQFAIVNNREMADYSWLMEKAAMETEMQGWKDGVKPSWMNNRIEVEARDVIIEEKSSNILVLNVAGIGKMYVEELMKELLHKGEEKWPVHFRHAVSRFKGAI